MDPHTSPTDRHRAGGRTVIVHPRYEEAREAVQRLPEIFDTEGVTLYRGRNVVKRFDTPYGTWVVKRYKRPNAVQRVAYTFFKKSKAERAYRYSWLLLERGIDTPRGIACILQKRGGLLQDSYFVSTFCNWPPLYPALVDTRRYDPQLAERLAAFLAGLHRQGVLHGDLNLNNILYTAGGTRFAVIDTNRSVFKQNPSRHECLDNLKRVTHRRDLLQDIVGRYARLRGWPPQPCIDTVVKAVEQFEKRKRLQRILTGRKPEKIQTACTEC